MFKVKNNLVPQIVAELFTFSPSRYKLRNSDFLTPRIRTTRYGKHSVRF